MQDTILALMKLISHIFEPEIMFPFVFLLGLCAYFLTKNKISSYILMSSSIVTMLIVKGLKVIIDKPRPENMLIVESAGKAFPSGHSAIAAVFTVLSVYFLNIYFKQNHIKNQNIRFFIVFLVIISFLLLPISRMYLHVHDIYDVTAGYFIGLLVTAFCIHTINRFFK